MSHLLQANVFLSRLCCALMIAAAVSVGSVARAQSSLTMYGIVDLSLYYNNVSRQAGAVGGAVNESQSGMASGVLSGSRWGIKGTEGLSNGWSVGFVLEGGINAQNGTLGQGGLGFGRQSTIGIYDRQLGSLEFGRRANFAYNYMVPIDPFTISGSQAGMGASFGSANGVRPNNLILYQTAVIDGWQAGIGYSFNTGFSAVYTNGQSAVSQSGTQFFGTNANMRMLTAGLRYNRGPLALVATYDAVYGAGKVVNSAGVQSDNTNNAIPKAWLVAGSYDFKIAKLSAAVGQTVDGVFFGQTAGAGGYSTPLSTFSDGSNILFAQGLRSFQYALGAVVPAGMRGKILLSWQGLTPSGSLRASNELATQMIYSAAYVYSLSKQTDLYIWGSYGNNYQTFSTAKSSVIGTGIRHMF